jgi:hypothetical protein
MDPQGTKSKFIQCEIEKKGRWKGPRPMIHWEIHHVFFFFEIMGVWNNLSIPSLIPWDLKVNDHVSSSGPEIYYTRTDDL